MDPVTLAQLHAHVQKPAARGQVRAPDDSVSAWNWDADKKRLMCPATGCGFTRATLSAVKAHLLEVHGWSSCAAYACYCAACHGAVLFADQAHATSFHKKAASFEKDQHLKPLTF